MRRIETIAESTNRVHVPSASSSNEYRSPAIEIATVFNESSTYRGPQIELLVIPDCPYATLAEALIAVTLNKLDLSHAPVLTTVIATTAEAARRRFTGSPSIVINGVDPWANPDGQPRLTCRVHPSPAGLPSPHDLAQALFTAVLDDHRVPH
jgi:hypothetical protein